MERFEAEKRYTKEELIEKFPEIATKTKELQAILNWFNSPEARNIAPDDYTRKELHYRKVEGTDLKTPHDFTGHMHIGEAVKKRYIDLFATAQTTEGYNWAKDLDRSEALRGAENFLLQDLPAEDKDKLRAELRSEVGKETERIKEEKEK